jgi:hypothetical protein
MKEQIFYLLTSLMPLLNDMFISEAHSWSLSVKLCNIAYRYLEQQAGQSRLHGAYLANLSTYTASKPMFMFVVLYILSGTRVSDKKYHPAQLLFAISKL